MEGRWSGGVGRCLESCGKMVTSPKAPAPCPRVHPELARGSPAEQFDLLPENLGGAGEPILGGWGEIRSRHPLDLLPPLRHSVAAIEPLSAERGEWGEVGSGFFRKPLVEGVRCPN